ncbi:MAG TPA: hypothetical protein VFB99_04495 [Vicinamibacterales bacterium]|nr:hypothetical protein [Vicinamibacterales bacterium]
MLAAFIAPRSVGALGTDEDREQQLIGEIETILSRDGPHSADLLAPLTSLALLYQESDDHGRALVTIERALETVRFNDGLHALEQVPLIRQRIRSEEARGNDVAVWELEQELLMLARRNRDDLQAVPVLREIADRQMHVLGRYLNGETPPQVFLGCFYQEWPKGNCDSGSRKTVVQGMLGEAQRNYADAIAVLLRNGRYDSPELRALELTLLRGVDSMRAFNEGRRSSRQVPMVPEHMPASFVEPWRGRIEPIVALAEWRMPGEPSTEDSSGRSRALRHLELMSPYQRGRQSLLRLYAYEVASGAPLLNQAAAAVSIADWDLLHSFNSVAVRGYTATRTAFDKIGAAALIEQLFTPPTPVVLPTFQPNPLAPDETRPATGHIDVAFDITKYGCPRGVRILDSANAAEGAADNLARLINRNRFRPRLTDGRFADVTPVVFRYYLYD